MAAKATRKASPSFQARSKAWRGSRASQLPKSRPKTTSSIQGQIAKEAFDRLLVKGFDPDVLAEALEVYPDHVLANSVNLALMKVRLGRAEEGLEALQKVVDTLIIIPNQNLFRLANEKTTFTEAFSMADDVLYQGVKGVTDLMVRPGLINLDFADVRAVMDEMGKAMMGTGEADGEDRATQAAEKAIANPLLDEISLKGAKGVLINIFMAEKTFEGCAGLEVTDEMKVTIAAQACLMTPRAVPKPPLARPPASFIFAHRPS